MYQRRGYMRRIIGVLAVLTAVGCGNEGPVAVPGTIRAAVVGPTATDGAAVIVLVGEAIESVAPVPPSELFASVGDEGTQVVLIHPTGGRLEFSVAVSDTTRPISAVVQEVAGPDDALRADVSAYSVEFGSAEVGR